MPNTSFALFIFVLIEFLNPSSSRGWFPKCLRDAKVDPLHKLGDIRNINTYRSFSILQANGKVFDKIMFERLYSIFGNKILFHSKQFGFVSNRSTFSALADFTDQIREGSTDIFTCILLYMRKAFGSINHEALLVKTEKSGARRISLMLFAS